MPPGALSHSWHPAGPLQYAWGVPSRAAPHIHYHQGIMSRSGLSSEPVLTVCKERINEATQQHGGQEPRPRLSGAAGSAQGLRTHLAA